MKSLFFLLLISSAALADDAAFLRCRAIADASARLACYDALPLPVTENKAEAKPGVPGSAPENRTAEAKPGALPLQTPQQFGLPRAPTEVVPVTESKAEAKPGVPGSAPENRTAEAKPGALPLQTPQQFGLPRAPTEVEIDAIESYIPGHFDGWVPNSRIRLANGQLWQIVDGSSRMLDLTDPKVTIRRGVLSAFYLEFEHDNRTARVKRLQ